MNSPVIYLKIVGPDGRRLRDFYADGYVVFPWREEVDRERLGKTVWSVFSRDTKYFEPSASPFMINYRVRDLDWLLEELRREGVEVDPWIEEEEYGRFAWVMDPEGNRIELWESPK
jgi:predicted enzyme related to lactoylglutathione lyase